jgi:hypothetical protein
MKQHIDPQQFPTVGSLIVRALMVIVAAALIGKTSRLLVNSIGCPEGCSGIREDVLSAVGYVLAVTVFAWVFFKLFLLPFRTYRIWRRRNRRGAVE